MELLLFPIIVVIFLGSIVLYGLSLLVYDKFAGTHYACLRFGWHNGNGGTKSFDGCSVHATCSKCKQEVMQDGQGNWF